MFRSALSVVLLGVAFSAAAEPLSFDAALEIATRNSPEVAAQTATVAASQSASVSAGAMPDPKLIVGVENLPVTGEERGSLTRDFMTMRKLGFAQEVPNGAKRAARTAEGEATVARAEAERRVTILAVRRDTALAWLNRYYLERRGALSRAPMSGWGAKHRCSRSM
jgi:cobalt-zinc-cadmium efflux system outer membrane protein